MYEPSREQRLDLQKTLSKLTPTSKKRDNSTSRFTVACKNCDIEFRSRGEIVCSSRCKIENDSEPSISVSSDASYQDDAFLETIRGERIIESHPDDEQDEDFVLHHLN